MVLDAADASFQAGMRAEQANSPTCVDDYYQTVSQAWWYLGPQVLGADQARAWNLYHVGLARLVVAGQRYGRFDPARGLEVMTPGGPGLVAIEYAGFVWQPGDFNHLEPTYPGKDRKLHHEFMQGGVGVTLLVRRQHYDNQGLIPPRAAFAATAVLTPGAPLLAADIPAPTLQQPLDANPSRIATLRLIDPLRLDSITIDGQAIPIARELSSAVSGSLGETQDSPTKRLFRSDTPNDYDGLRMLEPYQPGKIPIIFVHGLISDRATWANLTNELRVIPWVNARYQFWYFQYPTGEPFLRSALTLREQTQAAVARLDPQGQDPALTQMVMVGHSMGGLVSKLQVTYSSSTIWDAYANRPLPEIQGEPQNLDTLWRLFFFEPQPFLKRVVFIGTPHRGSAQASQIAGRFASVFVREPADRQQAHRALVTENPGVFAPEFERRIPTSVDLLAPESRLLAAMSRLSIAADVRIHSIVGVLSGRLGQPSDGIVPVSSALHPGVLSEYFVDVRHAQLTQHPETMAEVTRILAEHLRELGPR